MIELSIIIVNYNVKEFLLNLLSSIKKSLHNISAEVIIIDNASDDGSVELIREKYPDVKLIVNEKNVGFGTANNQGLAVASGKFFLLINPDTIVKEETLAKMIQFFNSTPSAGIAGCKVLNPDGTLQLACRRGFPGPWTSFTKVMGLSKLLPKSKLFAKYNLTYLDENQTYEVDAVSGAFMMLRREVYDRIGGFDQQFFMYGEDLDLCYRAQKAGFKVYYVHTTEVIHYKGESTKRSSIDETKIFYNAMHLFVRKHFSTSFLVEAILQSAILFRKLIAFANVYKNSIISILFDFIIFSGAVYYAEKIYSNERWIGFPEFAMPWVYFVPALLQILISTISGVYRKNIVSIFRSYISLFAGMIVLAALTYFFKQFAFSRAVVLITYVLAFVSFSVWRIIFKVIFKVGFSSETKKAKTIIVGDEENAAQLASKLKSNLTAFYQVCGLVGLTRKRIGENINSYKIIGAVDNIRKLITEEKINKVIFTSEGLSFSQMFTVVSECHGLNVEFMVAGNELDYLVGKSSIAVLDDIPLLKVQYNISSFSYQVTKQLFDFIFSLMLILLLVYPFIYLFQKFTSKKSDFVKFILGVPKVLVGKKSFVGPLHSSNLDGLFIGKEGLTGFWYVENIDRHELEEHKKLDLYYAKNQNIWLDLEILGRSFSKMLFKTE
ncbi:MAG: glycosyltransferase [Bacteroidota bacterium]